MLNETSQKKIVFHSSFFKEFLENGYHQLGSIFKDKKIIDATDVFIIIKDTNDKAEKIIHWTKEGLVLSQKPSQTNLENHQEGYQEILGVLRNHILLVQLYLVSLELNIG